MTQDRAEQVEEGSGATERDVMGSWGWEADRNSGPATAKLSMHPQAQTPIISHSWLV